jgi:hypothetical protein
MALILNPVAESAAASAQLPRWFDIFAARDGDACGSVSFLRA